MQSKAYAKLNWYLNVVGKRADGYHLLDMVNQRLSLHDTLDIVESNQLTLTVHGDGMIPTWHDNLVLKAAYALQDATGCRRGADMVLSKRIPAGAGLGGGSADAAATLSALNQLWETQLNEAQLSTMGARIGADIPYCLSGGLKRVQGIGEVVMPVSADLPAYPMIIIKPEASLATRDVFRELKADDAEPTMNADEFIAALAQGNFAALKSARANRLQAAATRLAPDIGRAVTSLYDHGATFAQMTGSGSAVYGVYLSTGMRDAAMETMQQQGHLCIATETINY